MEGSDACFAPVLSMTEAPAHDHCQHRGVFVEVDGVVQPAPAPRFDRTPIKVPPPAPQIGQDTVVLLQSIGHDSAQIDGLIKAGVVHQCAGA
nr:CoA transferase [Azospirillum sp. INR13]